MRNEKMSSFPKIGWVISVIAILWQVNLWANPPFGNNWGRVPFANDEAIAAWQLMQEYLRRMGRPIRDGAFVAYPEDWDYFNKELFDVPIPCRGRGRAVGTLKLDPPYLGPESPRPHYHTTFYGKGCSHGVHVPPGPAPGDQSLGCGPHSTPFDPKGGRASNRVVDCAATRGSAGGPYTTPSFSQCPIGPNKTPRFSQLRGAAAGMLYAMILEGSLRLMTPEDLQVFWRYHDASQSTPNQVMLQGWTDFRNEMKRENQEYIFTVREILEAGGYLDPAVIRRANDKLDCLEAMRPWEQQALDELHRVQTIRPWRPQY